MAVRYKNDVAEKTANNVIGLLNILFKKSLKKFLSAVIKTMGLPLIIVLIGLTIFLFLTSTFFSLPTEGAISGITKTAIDDRYIQEYKKMTENNFEAYLDGEKLDPPQLIDYYGNDSQHLTKWGFVHSVVLYRSYKENLNYNDIPHSLKESVADKLKPVFYYKTSKRIIHYKNSDKEDDEEEVYLLTKAYTVYGNFSYTYRIKTVDHETYTLTYEELDSVQLIGDTMLDDCIKDVLKEDKPEDIEIIKQMVIAAGEGFTEGRDSGEFLLGFVGERYYSQYSIPPEILSLFKEAEDKYGIPWWFIAAVSFKESSFNPQAENSYSGCFGLMQVSPANWETYAPKLGYDIVADKVNPKAQVMVGTYLLKNYIGSINWDGDWKEDSLAGLAFYGGYGHDTERARSEYAQEIWDLAESYKTSSLAAAASGWPVQGGYITSPFGGRRDPFTGEITFHHGIDIAVKAGTPVSSVSGGIATVTYDDTYGLHVIIKDATFEYLYAHLSVAIVKNGDSVNMGQLVGLSGNTGRSSGPHLHFGIKDLRTGNWIDPLTVLAK